MARFVVDSEVIAAKVGEAHGHIDRLTSEVNGMTTTLQDLQSTWTGTASSNFQNVLATWRQTQAQVEDAIAQINQALSTAGTNYADTESTNASMFVG